MATEWHYTIEGRQFGPVTPRELKQLVDGGDIGGEDLVWKEGMADWVPVSQVRGLAAQPVPAATAAPPANTSASDSDEPRLQWQPPPEPRVAINTRVAPRFKRRRYTAIRVYAMILRVFGILGLIVAAVMLVLSLIALIRGTAEAGVVGGAIGMFSIAWSLLVGVGGVGLLAGAEVLELLVDVATDVRHIADESNQR